MGIIHICGRFNSSWRPTRGLPVELRVNITAAELQELYHRASLFWHFCGFGQSDPALVEHFGMTVAEAMQSGCIPLVFDGGGMREIVRSGKRLSFPQPNRTGRHHDPAARFACIARQPGRGGPERRTEFRQRGFRLHRADPGPRTAGPGAIIRPRALVHLGWTGGGVCVIFPKMNITGRIQISRSSPSTTRRRASPSSMSSSAGPAPDWGDPTRSSSSTTELARQVRDPKRLRSADPSGPHVRLPPQFRPDGRPPDSNTPRGTPSSPWTPTSRTIRRPPSS